MNKLYTPLILLAIVGMASAAVHVIVAPHDAKLSFTRELPAESEIMTLIEIGDGFGSRCDIGEMGNNALNRRIIHLNQAESAFDGCVYFEMNCTTGMNDTANGIEDFESVTYTCPNGTEYSCNNHACIGRISPTSIAITPPMDTYTFLPDMVETFSDIEIVFVDGAYGDYVLTVWTDNPPNPSAII